MSFIIKRKKRPDELIITYPIYPYVYGYSGGAIGVGEDLLNDDSFI